MLTPETAERRRQMQAREAEAAKAAERLEQSITALRKVVEAERLRGQSW